MNSAVIQSIDSQELKTEIETGIAGLIDCGRYFHQRGWSLGTSSNYSVVLQRDPVELLITASGKFKERLGESDFVRIDVDGAPSFDGQPKSSAETMLHCLAANDPSVGAILHTHSVWGTVLSDLFFDQGSIQITGFEMQKGLEGITTHESTVTIPIFENTQDIPALAKEVMAYQEDPSHPKIHGYLIRRHGLYTWGENLDQARRHIEVFEFLFESLAQRQMLRSNIG